jgi:hypothetical protein
MNPDEPDYPLSGDSIDGPIDDAELDAITDAVDMWGDETPTTARRSSKKKKKKRGSEGYDLIRAALESHLIDYAKRKNDQKRNVEQLTAVIEEFLSSFILLGYNYDGDPITLVSATTQQQSDSLSTLIQKFIMSQHGGRDPSGGSGSI